MTRMLNLRDIFELINHSFNDRSATKQNAIGLGDQLVLHIATKLGEEMRVEHRP